MTPARKYVTYYDVLGVQNDAPTDEIRKAYRKKALETHPDKLDVAADEKEKQAAERKFHQVNEAFQTLGDAYKRRKYDALLAVHTDPTRISAESAARKADRHEWARQQEEMVNRRISDFKQKMEQERARKIQKKADEEARVKRAEEEAAAKKAAAEAEEKAKIKKKEDIYAELKNERPDLIARREAILKRKAERERLAKERAELQIDIPPLSATSVYSTPISSAGTQPASSLPPNSAASILRSSLLLSPIEISPTLISPPVDSPAPPTSASSVKSS